MQPIVEHQGATYKNRGNQRVRVVTPSGRIVDRRIKKKAKMHRCHGCNRLLPSIAALRPAAFSRLKLSQRRISRMDGSTHCGKCTAAKIVAAVLTEEERLVNQSQSQSASN